jgi:hypothetical protein
LPSIQLAGDFGKAAARPDVPDEAELDYAGLL